MYCMIKVHCIGQEYWYIRKKKCECGGDFESQFQSLETREGTFVDVHRTICKKCGMGRDFVFDISSFHNPLRSYQDLADVEAVIKKVYPEDKELMRMASPMEATLIYINHLASSGDRSALQYIAEAILHALEDKNK